MHICSSALDGIFAEYLFCVVCWCLLVLLLPVTLAIAIAIAIAATTATATATPPTTPTTPTQAEYSTALAEHHVPCQRGFNRWSAFERG